MVGSTVSRWEISNIPGFAVGDWVLSQNGWQEYAISDGRGVLNLERTRRSLPMRWGAGHAGIHGLYGAFGYWTAEAGRDGGGCRGDRSVGSVVGQIAKLKECRVVGIAGGAEKCRYAVEELGFDTCLDHRGPKLHEEWRRRARKALMCTTRMLVGWFLMPCFRCSTRVRAFPCAG